MVKHPACNTLLGTPLNFQPYHKPFRMRDKLTWRLMPRTFKDAFAAVVSENIRVLNEMEAREQRSNTSRRSICEQRDMWQNRAEELQTQLDALTKGT